MTAGAVNDDPGREAPARAVSAYRAALARAAVGVVVRPPVPGHPGEPGGPGGGVDEVLDASGEVREATADLAASIDLLGTTGLLTRRAQARRLVEDDGVTYGTADGAAPARRWAVDPLPTVLDAAQWHEVETSLAQRADLLDALLTDLYGPRTLLRHRLLPPELIFGHRGFLREADQVRLPGSHQLFLTATDLARDGEGRWTVLADRTQAPSGAGYAMENRRVVSRVMPGLYRDSRLERLRSFFHTVRAALQEIAPATAEVPRVVLLTPGAGSETAFDQSFLATLLGYPLVEGGDLTVREGRVWMRALGRLEPVDVVLRRVDAWFADPLELRADSRLGVPGLLEAARRGTVSVVNPLGAGVLENPGLLPFLPALSRALLDSDLAMPSVTTWWCGDDASRRHVLDRLDTLVVKPIAREVGRAGRFGWELSAAQRDQLRARIEAEPHAWTAQEPLAMSTAPVVTSRGLEPRSLVLRSFGVAQGGAYRFMAGGLGRVAARVGSRTVSSQDGGLSKDVWVLSPDGAGAGDIRAASLTPYALVAPPAGITPAMAPRIAEDLFWLGRYAERAEDAVRLLRVVDDLAEDYSRRPGSVGASSLAVLLEALTHVTTAYPGFAGPQGGPRREAPHGELLALVVDAGRPGTLAFAVRRTVEAAHAVREQLSLDTWLVLGSLDRVVGELADRAGLTTLDRPGDDPPLQPTLARVLEGLLALAGLGAESMVRDAGWYFMDAGRRLERALQLISLLRHTLTQERSTAVDGLVVESVLIAAESIITHRRRHPSGLPGGVGGVLLTGGALDSHVAGVLELLLLDRTNPRALAHQLDRLVDDVRHLPEPTRPAELGAMLRDVVARLRESDPAALVPVSGDGRRPALAAFLDTLAGDLTELALGIEAAHFVHVAPPRPLPAAAGGWGA